MQKTMTFLGSDYIKSCIEDARNSSIKPHFMGEQSAIRRMALQMVCEGREEEAKRCLKRQNDNFALMGLYPTWVRLNQEKEELNKLSLQMKDIVDSSTMSVLCSKKGQALLEVLAS